MKQDEKVVSALEADIKLGVGIAITGYMLPDATFRYGLEYLSVLLGYADNYVSRLIKKDKSDKDEPDKRISQVTKNNRKKLKALQSKGFTGYQIPVKVARSTGGATKAKTLGFDDFAIFVEYEAVEEKNPKAIALLTSAFKELLRGRTLEAFGLPEESLETKQADFSASFYEREAYYIENREDVDNQVMLGDEDLDIAEYDTSAAQWENNLLYSKYFDDVA